MLICVPMNLLGICYIVFVMKEPKSEKPAIEPNAADNRGFEIALQDNMTQIPVTPTAIAHPSPLDDTKKKKTNCLIDFFDPTVAIQCAQIIIRKRENRGREIIIFMFFLYFISLGPLIGEGPNEYNFTRYQLNWGSVAYSHYSTYTSALGLISTTIMITLFKKWLKLHDASIGVISSALGCVTRILFVNIFFKYFFSIHWN